MVEVEGSIMFHDFELPFVPFVFCVFGVLLLVGILLCVSYDGASEIQNHWTGFVGPRGERLELAETVCPGTLRNSSLQD